MPAFAARLWGALPGPRSRTAPPAIPAPRAFLRRLATCLLPGVLVLGGCAGWVGRPVPRFDAESPETAVRDCSAWFARMDAEVAFARVGDAQATRVPGFPALRVDRLLASFAPQAEADPAAFDAWWAGLRALDAAAREVELGNLPAPARAHLGGSLSGLRARLAQCGARLAQADRASPARRSEALARAKVPDDYAGWKRVLGLYPLTRHPFFAGVRRWQREMAEAMQAAGPGVRPPTRAYAPGGAPQRAAARALLARAPRDALGIPHFSAEEAAALLAAYAPRLVVETASDDDLPGRPVWADDAGPPAIDTAAPALYGRVAATRFRGAVLTQLVYTVWFPARPRAGLFDPLSGALDGVILRLTLDAAGEPLVADSIHACGCYHVFFPSGRLAARPPPREDIEWLFAPRRLPPLPEDARYTVRLAARSHYVLAIEARRAEAGRRYAIEPNDRLRSLPRPGGGHRSLYGPDGIVPGTDRGEALFFWPMGIDRPGAMRQWGRHATAFVGRRHFDDPDLLERRFDLNPE